MPNVLSHRPEQTKAAALLGDAAKSSGDKALSRTTMAAAKSLVSMVLKDSGAGPIGEAAGDVRVLRTDAKLNANLIGDLDGSELEMTGRMLVALESGYDSEMAFQCTAIKGLDYDITKTDRSDMASYPIQGHTCAEISEYMHRSLRYEVEGLLASPLTGDAQIQMLPQLLGDSASKFGDRCSAAVQEAFFAGVQMAIRGVAAAMSN